MRILISLLVIVSILHGCGPATTKPVEKAEIDPEQQAQLYLNNKNYSAAASEYKRLAELDNDKRDYYYIRAARSYLSAQQITDAENIYKLVNADNLSQLESYELLIIKAKLELASDNIKSGLQTLSTTLPEEVTDDVKIDYYQTKALLFEQDGQLLNAAKERVALSQVMHDPVTRTSNLEKIWALINANDTDVINTYRLDASHDVSSWLELAIINKTMLDDRGNLEVALNEWSQRYPAHPATDQIIPDILAYVADLDHIPQQVALLLPFYSNRLGDAANAIKDGFLAAWYLSDNEKPLIRTYDTSQGNITTIYQNAIDEGAEYIIGPLEKNAVEQILSLTNHPVKTLVLNHTEQQIQFGQNTSTPIPEIIQFGLSPEDDAIQIAERAWFEGMINALVISSADSSGDRIRRAFEKRWSELGGNILDRKILPAEVEHYSDMIKEVLNIDKSEQRQKSLQARLRRKIHAEPRRRQDIDFILLAVNPVAGRQIMPQLRFYRAEEVPVYAPSSIYAGRLNPAADKDLDQVIFTDIPWVVDPSHEYSELQRLLEGTENQSISTYRRLYAFGIDAYTVLINMGALSSGKKPLRGETGLLKLGENGKVLRKLTFARFLNGTPVLLDN